MAPSQAQPSTIAKNSMRFEQIMATRSPGWIPAERSTPAHRATASQAFAYVQVVPAAVTRGFCANRLACRVSIAGSVRSAGANNCDHCLRNADAEVMAVRPPHRPDSLRQRVGRAEADGPALVNNAAGFQNIAIVGNLERCAGILLDQENRDAKFAQS